MHKEAKEELNVRLKLVVLELVNHFGVTTSLALPFIYTWKQEYDKIGQSGLYRKKPAIHNYPCKTAQEVIEKILELRIRISTVRTDRGHQFQARFHWQFEDQGIWHVYIKPRIPQLNGQNVERLY